MMTPDELERLASARPEMASRGAEVLDDRERADLLAAIVAPTPGRRSPSKHLVARHRRTWIVVVGVTAALILGVYYGPRSSDHGVRRLGSSGSPTTAGPSNSSSMSFLGRAMPKTVTFDSIARLGATLVASGRVQGACVGSGATGCRAGRGSSPADLSVEPVVWTSSDDGYRWTQAWKPGQSLIKKNASSSQLVEAPAGSLLLFVGGTPGTVVLRATRPKTWTALSLPASMASAALRSVTDTGSEVVASMVNRSGGLTTFTSTSGFTWEESSSALYVSLRMEENGLAAVSFGASPRQVESILDPTLSAPTATPVSGCAYHQGPPQFTEIEWGDLVVEFNEGFFVGYRDILGGWSSIGSFSSPTGNPDPAFTTATGIGLGSSFAQLQMAYPGLARTGSFTWTSPGGIHFVLGSAAPVSAQSTIIEIKTGTCGDF
jgi:hypothetical protein